MLTRYTVGPLNNRHVGGRDLVLYREVVPTDYQATLLNPKVEWCGLWEVESTIVCKTHSELTKIEKK